MAWIISGILCPSCGHCDSLAAPGGAGYAVLTCRQCHHERLEPFTGYVPADQTPQRLAS